MTRFPPQWIQSANYAASVDRRLIGALWPNPASSGMAVTIASGMTLNIAAGQAAVPASNQTGSVLCTSDAVEQVIIAAAPVSPLNRIDVITVMPRGTDLDGGTNNDWIFNVIQGVAANSPFVPSVPFAQTAIAQVLVPGNAAAIVQGNITDVRPGNLAIPATVPKGTGMRYDRNTGFTMPATPSTAAIIPCQSRTFDDFPANTYNTTSGIFTCPAAGVYSLSLQLGWNMANSGGYVITLYAYKNGAAFRTNSMTQGSNPGYAQPQVNFNDRAAAGDTYAMWGQINVASAAGLRGLNETSISIAYLGS